MRKPVLAALLSLLLSAGCGVVYQSPSVNSLVESDTKLRVQRITPESTLVANSSAYAPKTLPRVFFTSSGATATTPETESLPRPIGGPGGSGTSAASGLELRVPPEVPLAPYRIGVGDVLLLATPQTGSTVEELTGLLAASNSRQGYTAQDDGAIAIPNVGRVRVVGLTLEEAENLLFQRLVENKIDPTFSLEVAEFNSQSISIGGAVSNPTVVPIGLRPVTIDQALAAAGGVAAGDLETASVRIYREGVLYQIPLETLYSDRGLQRTRLIDGDSLFIDTRFELDQAQAFFQQEIRAAEFDQRARINALDALQTQFDIRRAGLQEARDNFLTRLDLGAEKRDYAYLAGEVRNQGRFALPFGQTASLADAIYSSEGIPTVTGNVAQIYVLRSAPDPRDFGAVTAWHLDARNAANLTMAARFELRPNDVVFVAEQPVTRWGRVITQITPSLLTTGAVIANSQ